MTQSEKIKAPSGKVYDWTTPPRRVHWKHGRTGRTLAAKVQEIAEAADREAEETGTPITDDERGARILEAMSDGELEKLEAYADDVLTHGLGRPPGNMPDPDYWHLFGRSVFGDKKQKVETEEGDTTVEAVETFRKKLSLPSDGEDVPDVRPAPIEGDGAAAPAAV